MLCRNRVSLVVLVAGFALHSLGLAQAVSQKNRILGPIDENDAVTLVGNTHPWARPEFERGEVADETVMQRMVLVLQPDAAQQKELDSLVEAQHTPGSPYYHQWLTPEEYGARFGASAADIAQIAGWLQSRGFTVEPVSESRRVIVFTGNAGQIKDAFHTEMHHYMVDGQLHVANAQDPQIPRALAPVVNGILSLHDFRRKSQISSVRRMDSQSLAKPEITYGTYHYLVPADYGIIYDLNPQYSAGMNGSGVSIAIVGRSDINLSDVSSFRSNFGLPSNQPTVIHDGTDPGINDADGDQDESTLDVEWSGAVGYGATIDFVVAKSTATTDGVDLAAQYIVDHDLAPVMSTSYGSCEADEGSSELAFYNNLWEQAASEGISSFVSAGDSGAAGCNPGSSTKGTGAGVNGLCSSPYSTCVGGTEFSEGSGTYWSGTNNSANGSSALSYIPEKVWNESALDGGSGLWAGGGGVSEVYSQPSWQAGITGSSANGMRTVPDVSLTAAAHDAYMIWENGEQLVISGTSAASPAFAGIMSMVVQKQGGQWQGNANPTLYSLLDAQQYPFHPTMSGNNSVPGVTGFTANGAAYNLATGLGSVDGDILVNQWPSSGTSVQKAVVLDTSASSISIFPGTSTTFSLTAVGSAGFSGTLTLKAVASSGVTVGFSSTSVKTGASVTVTVTAASTAAVGTGSVVITGTSGSYTPTVTMGLTVKSPAITVTPGASSVTTFQGQSTTFTVATGAASGYVNSIILSATAPTGVTVTFSPASVKPGASATATVTASTTATAGTGSITVKAASGSSLVTASESVTVVAPTLTVTPGTSSVSTFQGQSTTFTVAVGATTGYTNAIVLSATAPTGVTVSFSPASLKPGGSATATVTPSTSSAAGTGTITVKATSGAATATASEGLTVTLPTLTVVPSASSLSVFQGQTATFTVQATASSGFTNPIALSGVGPTGVTVSYSPASVKPGASATATVTASATAAAGTGSISVKGAAGSASTSASVPVTVVAPTLTVTPSTSSVSTFQGQSTTFTVAVGATSGYTNAIVLSATAPTGVAVSFSPASVKPGASATATVTASTTAAAGTGSITVKGTSGSAVATASEGVTVVAPTLTVSPSTSSVSTFQGQSTTFTVAVGATTGYTNAIVLSATAPTGVAVSFSPASVKPGASATATVTASTTSVAGADNITIKGTSGSAVATASEGVTVVAPTLTVTPSTSSVDVLPGKTTTFAVAVTATSGFINAITLKATAPAGVTVSFSPASVKPGASATVTVSAAASAVPGTATISITATSGTANATGTAALTVQ